MNRTIRLRTHDVVRTRASDSIDRVMEVIRAEYEPLDLGDTLTIKTILARNATRAVHARDSTRSAAAEAGRRASEEARAAVEPTQALQRANRRVWP